MLAELHCTKKSNLFWFVSKSFTRWDYLSHKRFLCYIRTPKVTLEEVKYVLCFLFPCFLVLFIYSLFFFFFSFLEICLNFYGLVKAAYGHKSFAIDFNFVLILLITIGHTKSILSIFFLGGKITDMVNTTQVSIVFNLNFQFEKTFHFQPI